VCEVVVKEWKVLARAFGLSNQECAEAEHVFLGKAPSDTTKIGHVF